MTFELSRSRMQNLVAASIVALMAIGFLFTWAVPVSAQSTAPAEPDTPTLRALHKGMVEVDWNDVPRADRYEVQFWGNDGWIDLPATDIGIEAFFYGSKVIVTGLPKGLSYDAFQVRASNVWGRSGWSDYGWQTTTYDMNWDGVPIPELAPTPTPVPRKPAPNIAATGAPTIEGKVEVGQTLTASTSTVADANGLSGSTFTYMWLLDDAEITGAVNASYTLVESEKGKAISVRVDFTDDHGFAESLTSEGLEVILGDDHGDSPGTATELFLDTWVQGTISDSDDVDFFEIEILEPTHIALKQVGPDHRRRGAGDRFSSAGNFHYTILKPDGKRFYPDNRIYQPGTYYVKVDRFLENHGPERYRFMVFGREDQGDTIDTATHVVLNEPQPPFSLDNFLLLEINDEARLHGAFSSREDVDLFKLELATATKVRLYIFGPPLGLLYRTSTGGVGVTGIQVNVALLDSNGDTVGTPHQGFPSTGYLYQLDAGTHYFRLSPYIRIRDGKAVLWKYSMVAVPEIGEEEPEGICDRSQQVMESILGILKQQVNYQCGLVTDDHLNGITGGIYLQDSGLIQLRPDDFQGLSKLEVLWLGHNRLTSLEDSQFDELSNIKVLSLKSNELETLPSGLFDNLTDLRGLYLENNSLTTLPDGVFDNLENLEILSLASNDLGSLPEGIFANLTSLRKIYLGGNGFTELPEGTFAGLTNLETVSLSDEDPPPPFKRPRASGLPAVTGTAAVGMTLGVNTLGIIQDDCWSGLKITDLDSQSASYSYQWIVTDGITDTEIPGATSANYTLTTSDEGKTVKVRVTLTDCFDQQLTLTSPPSLSVVSQPPESGGICYRSATVKNAILSTLSSVNRCEDVTSVHLSSITGGLRINVGGQQVWEGEFTGLNNLKELEIAAYQLVGSFPEGIFDELSSLEVLRLRIWGLPSASPPPLYPETLFDNLVNLKELDISGNRLASLPEGSFNDLRNLETLRLSRTRLTSLPIGAFDNLTELKTLDLTGHWDLNTNLRELHGPRVTGLKSLPDGIFDNLENLEWLSLSANSFSSLPEGAFDDLSSLKVLKLRRNKEELATLPNGAFSDLSYLEELYLDNSNILSVPGDAFDDATSLKRLWLGNNIISSLPQGLFNDLLLLEELSLYDNGLTSLPSGSFDGLTRLKKLLLSYNDLQALPDGLFDDLHSLELLEIYDNALTTLPSGLFNGLAKVKELNMSYNALESLPDRTFEGMSSLERLIVDFNPGSPLILELVLEEKSDDSVVVKLAKGAPFDIDIALRAEGGLLSVGSNAGAESVTVTVEAGSTTSVPISVSSNSGVTEVTITLLSALFRTGEYFGIQTAIGDDFLLTPVVNARGNAPTISGVAQVGETLTVITSGVSDSDGLTNPTFSYQWLADDTDIAGATASTYTLVAADLGKTIKVRVSFTDDADNEETLTSTATATISLAVQLQTANSLATGLPTVRGTAQVGETLTADTSGIVDEDGLENATFSYQWVRNDGTYDSDISGATGSTYTLVDADQGKNIKVKVSFTDDADSDETLTSAATASVAAKTNTPATGLPTITGTPEVGETLTADTSGISDEDGLTSVSYSYQWLADDADISGATGSTHLLTTSEMSKAIKVKVSFTDDRGNAEVLTSAATGAVAPAIQEQSVTNSPAAGAPTITGTAQVGQTLTADTSGISDEDGLTSVSYSYQWVRNDGTSDTDISGATGSAYALMDDDQGKTIKVQVSFTDDAHNDETLTSAATAQVAARPNSPATGIPTIGGTAQVGETLTADTFQIADEDGLDNVSFSYQWVRNDGIDDADIAGATGATYTLVAADRANTIKVQVSFTDDAHNDETLTSSSTIAVAGQALTARLENEPETHDGDNRFSFELRFSEEFSLSYKTLRDKAFTVTGGTVKVARRLDKPSNIHWEIVIEPDSVGEVTVVLPTTEDCEEEGAICTEDGRKLANRLELTVNGPSQ